MGVTPLCRPPSHVELRDEKTIGLLLALSLIVPTLASASIGSTVSSFFDSIFQLLDLSNQTAQVAPAVTTTTTAVACTDFSRTLEYGQESWINFAYGYASYASSHISNDQQQAVDVSNLATAVKNDTAKLQNILTTSEGASINDAKGVYGIDTVKAVFAFQNKYNIPGAVPGVFDAPTFAEANQLYGCLNRASVTLVSPNGKFKVFPDQSISIKYSLAKIPNTTNLTISYLTAPSSVDTTVVGNVIAVVTSVKNGNGTYTWQVPTGLAPGEYKLRLVLTGSTKSDVSDNAFTVTSQVPDLSVSFPDSGTVLTTGQVYDIKWKSLTGANDTYTISLTGPGVSNITLGTVNALAGDFKWQVPTTITPSDGFGLLFNNSTNPSSLQSASKSFSIEAPSTSALNFLIHSKFLGEEKQNNSVTTEDSSLSIDSITGSSAGKIDHWSMTLMCPTNLSLYTSNGTAKTACDGRTPLNISNINAIPEIRVIRNDGISGGSIQLEIKAYDKSGNVLGDKTYSLAVAFG